MDDESDAGIEMDEDEDEFSLGLDTGAASAFCPSLVANLRLRWVTWKIEHCGLVLFGGVSPNDKAGS
ncbi:hypothetical protein HPB47_024723 [Ixodes persulcatus]|uniref:Uncharacterized protein n=1 Tax=Ixodes persulcatus TaxID=34615 RepID=A0AC60Q3Y4_IXOPE|nr:hypothetical protein HPB47_024723 [Ixodes persulcatus]